MLHPFIPHITEELWQHFKSQAVNYKLPEGLTGGEAGWTEALMTAKWPEANPKLIDQPVEETMGFLIQIIRGVRDIRNKMNIDRKQPLSAVFSVETPALKDLISAHLELIKRLERWDKIEVAPKAARPPHSATEIITSGTHRLAVYVPLEGIINLEAEEKRLQLRLKKTTEALTTLKNKLAQHDFRQKAPRPIVEKAEQRLNELTTNLAQIQSLIEALG